MKYEFSRQIFEKSWNAKFNENPSSGSRVPSGRTERRTDMTKLRVSFRNFANLARSNMYALALVSNTYLQDMYKILCSVITQMDNTASVVQFLLYLSSHSRTWTNTNTGSQQLELSSLDRSHNMYVKRDITGNMRIKVTLRRVHLTIVAS
jgi:hypothetical protein